MAYSFSRTWKSDTQRAQESRRPTHGDRTQELERFRRAYPNFKRLYKENQALLPWTFDAWLRHRADATQASHEELSRRVAVHEQDQREMAVLREQTGRSHLQLFGGANYLPGSRTPWPSLSPVLCQQTMWCQDWWVDHREGANTWPDAWELKFEGDDRVNSAQWPDYRRYMPLPRQPRPSIELQGQWSLRPRLLQYDFDEIYRPKSFEDIYYPVEEVDEELGQHLLGSLLTTFSS